MFIGACFATIVVASTKVVKCSDVQLHTTYTKSQMQQQSWSDRADTVAAKPNKATTLVAGANTNNAALLPKVKDMIGAHIATSTKTRLSTKAQIDIIIAADGDDTAYDLSFVNVYHGNSMLNRAAKERRRMDTEIPERVDPLTSWTAESVLDALLLLTTHTVHSDNIMDKEEATRKKEEMSLEYDRKCWLAVVIQRLEMMVDLFENSAKETYIQPDEVTDQMARAIFCHYIGDTDVDHAKTIAMLSKGISLINPKSLNLPQKDIDERRRTLYCLQVDALRLLH